MVNHIRTLLLNTTAAQLTSVSGIYVPRDFAPVRIPDEFKPLSVTLFPAKYSLSERVLLVDALMPILHCGELVPYALRFDTRTTYRDIADDTLTDLCQRTTTDNVYVNALVRRLGSIVGSTVLGTRLFIWDTYQDDLTALRSVWAGSLEGTLRIGGLVLAYAYQLERARRSS